MPSITKSTDYFSKEVFSKDVSNYKMVSTGQFAYNPSRINVGSIDYLKCTERALVSPLYIVFETPSKIHPDYLLRYLKADWGNLQIRANTEGAVRDSLKFKGLESIKIPLPPNNNEKTRLQEIVITTHSPFVLSDMRKRNVFVFDKSENKLKYIECPIETYGASAGIILDAIFGKEDTISEKAKFELDELFKDIKNMGDIRRVVEQLNSRFGDSVEKLDKFNCLNKLKRKFEQGE